MKRALALVPMAVSAAVAVFFYLGLFLAVGCFYYLQTYYQKVPFLQMDHRLQKVSLNPQTFVQKYQN